MKRLGAFVDRNLAGLAVWAGATMVWFALEYGAGFHIGWWGLLLWVGLGFIWGGLVDKINEIVRGRP